MTEMELPVASEAERKSRVTHYPDIPKTELVPGCHSHLMFGEHITVSFLTMPANGYFPPHRHEQEADHGRCRRLLR